MKRLHGSQTGLVEFCSWRRLAEDMVSHGMITVDGFPPTTIRGFKVDGDRGLEIYLDFTEEGEDAT